MLHSGGVMWIAPREGAQLCCQDFLLRCQNSSLELETLIIDWILGSSKLSTKAGHFFVQQILTEISEVRQGRDFLGQRVVERAEERKASLRRGIWTVFRDRGREANASPEEETTRTKPQVCEDNGKKKSRAVRQRFRHGGWRQEGRLEEAGPDCKRLYLAPAEIEKWCKFTKMLEG